MDGIPNMEEIGDVVHVDVERDGIEEGPVGVDVESVDPGEGQPRLRRWLGWTRTTGLAMPTSGCVDVLFPGNGGAGSGSGGGRQAHEAQCGHDGLELVVGHDGLEGPGEPEG